MSAFIADASVAIAWVHPAQATVETDAMLDALEAGAVIEVPGLWPLEVANALVVLVRRRKLAEEDRLTALGWLRGLSVRIDYEMASLAFSSLSELAHRIACPSTTPHISSSRNDGLSRWRAKMVL